MARNRKLVPESKKALDQMKYEIAAELGLFSGHAVGDAHSEFASELGSMSGSSAGSIQWGNVATRDAGLVGGNITARLIRKAEDALLSL
ncbi:alpha/beta-type small acid-soluble spore protein [Paenibacillus albiflavus]|uniref:Alpha/beta-type small acid-soluble spore protein n=1 Tax=Paenibacillus albiflavus TaxID=2545760 RepID=A0A4R4EBY2_9BACL|nr:alpha/beta-type small acid-soluble spore protein [Paenibacillus albiflavus]TCZ76827.1 alpha/beta-type small acid-soluble spore protein [Paenibacillus albiflavus]